MLAEVLAHYSHSVGSLWVKVTSVTLQSTSMTANISMARTKFSKLGAYQTNAYCGAGKNCITKLVQVKSMLIKHMVTNPAVLLARTTVHLYNQTALQSPWQLRQSHTAFLYPCPQGTT